MASYPPAQLVEPMLGTVDGRLFTGSMATRPTSHLRVGDLLAGHRGRDHDDRRSPVRRSGEHSR